MTTNFNNIFNQYNETERKAIEGAMWAHAMCGNGNAPETEAEFKAFCDEVVARHNEYIAKENAKAERKAVREAAKAEALGMNEAEYNEYKKMVAKKKRHETEMRKAQKAIEEAQARLEYEMKVIAETEKKIAEMEKGA